MGPAAATWRAPFGPDCLHHHPHGPRSLQLMLRTTFSFLFGTMLVAQAPVAPAPANPAANHPAANHPAAMGSIVAKDLLADATYLASEELGGRLTGSPGQQMAADYIAKHFETLGLEPLGDTLAGADGEEGKRGFFQWYGIARTAVAPDSVLQLGALQLTDGYAILGGHPVEARVEGKLRFAGLGRTRGSSAEIGEGETLDDQIPVVLIKSRAKADRALSVEQKFMWSFQTFGQLGKTTKNLEKKGARAVLYLQLDDPNGLSDVLNYLALSPGKDSLAPRFPGAEDSMGMMSTMLGGGEGPLAMVMSVSASGRILAELGLDRAELAAFVAGDGELPHAKAEVLAKLRVTVTHDEKARASNVCAVLRGSDPKLAGEALVYSAHMDHVGRRLDGVVFHGADDNASGSAGLLAIARAYATSAEKPRRSIIFLSVSGEELGLWGSAYYADHPTWPVEQIVADINTDMIGRSGAESGPMEVTVTPSHGHDQFSTIVQDAAKFAGEFDMSFQSGDKYYMRSDHYNFAKKGIPVVFFCTGEHEDYHQVTDTADKLDGAKMERIARLSFLTGWSVANADERPRILGRRKDWR
jgi:hypothetical protein